MSGPRTVEPAPGHPEILRVTAPNPGPMTLAGTNTYVVGEDPAWIVDPGPADPAHIGRVREEAERRGGIAGVLLTHDHVDHSAGVAMLGAALVWGRCGVDDESRAMLAVDLDAPIESAPLARPDAPAEAGPFAIIPTPGHAPDHVAFGFGAACFCGDLILGEGSSIVPPASGGGSLVDYMASLDRVEALEAELLCPGHGPWITDPAAKIAEYRGHRQDRESRLEAALEEGERSRGRLLAVVWDDVPAPLRPAAALVMRAHLEKLAADGLDLSDLRA